MAGRSSKWVRGCALGCGVVALLVVLGIGLGTYVMQQPFRVAIQVREDLEAAHGPTDSFTPAPDGAIPPERIEAFLHVRRSLQEACRELEASHAQFEALDELDDRGEPTAGEIRGALWSAMKTAVGMGPRMGSFFRTRNVALAEVDMGLGEYTYLYALAYAPSLRSERPGGAGRLFSERVQSDLRQMLRNQRAALDSLGEDAAAEFRVLLEHEIGALESDPARIPWEDGPPPPIEASLAPHRDEIDALSCPDAFNLELTRNERFWIGIQGD